MSKLNEERAEYLVETYSDMLLRIGYTWLGDLDDAKDVCQITLIKAWKEDKLFPDTGQEKAWIIRIAVNECKNWKTSAWFRHRVSLDDAASLTVQLPESTELLELVQTLPPKFRQVIYLRYYEGYEVKEIAELLGIRPALVSTHLARAKEKLRKLFKEEFG